MGGRKNRGKAAGNLRASVIEEHARSPHPGLKDQALRVHLLIHEFVEGQLQKNDPVEVAEAMRRLRRQGLSRHDAIHAIGMVVARQAWSMLQEHHPLDRSAYLRDLETLGIEERPSGKAG